MIVREAVEVLNQSCLQFGSLVKWKVAVEAILWLALMRRAMIGSSRECLPLENAIQHLKSIETELRRANLLVKKLHDGKKIGFKKHKLTPLLIDGKSSPVIVPPTH